MFRSWLAAVALVVAAGSASAQSDLPEDVRRSYVAYNAAMQAEDYERALPAAHAAWRAAEAADYDPVVTATLADNYAQLADALGRYEEAGSAYRAVVRLQQEIGESPGVIGQTWRLAATAALSAGDTRGAIRLADTAGDLLQNATEIDPGLRANELFLSRAIQAHALWRDGSMRGAALRAQQAFDALADHDLTSEGHFALLSFYLGALAAARREDTDAAYWLSVAHTWMVREGSHPEMRTGLGYWADYARGRLDSDDRLALFRRLAGEGMVEEVESESEGYQECAERGDAELADDPANRDAVALERRPPRYPERAAMAGAEGVVVIRYAIDETGRTQDIEVLFSIPFADFAEPSVEAVERWRFDPARVGGEPVRQECRMTTIEYILEG
ncbi:energy transducer TonB [Marinicauda algicola]|nr:energy transducer TonB [Marinicauda algicola]